MSHAVSAPAQAAPALSWLPRQPDPAPAAFCRITLAAPERWRCHVLNQGSGTVMAQAMLGDIVVSCDVALDGDPGPLRRVWFSQLRRARTIDAGLDIPAVPCGVTMVQAARPALRAVA